MPQLSPTIVLEIAERFEIDGTVASVEPWGSGHIHDTWRSVVRNQGVESRFVHQRINTSVFPAPQQVMQNIERVTRHLRSKLEATGEDAARRVLTVVPTLDGRSLLRTAECGLWRTYRSIDGASALDTARGPEHVYQVARAFARFTVALGDLPGPRLHETILGFGDVARRFADLVRARDEDVAGRVAGVEAELAFAAERRKIVAKWAPMVAGLPERIIHYDTKINNVLIDDATGEGICVIDLDTTMPGTALYDFGDLVRFGATRAAEDERDLSGVTIDVELFDALVRGYLGASAGSLDAGEIDRLVQAARTITFTAGVRFLADYLSGDRYFKTHRNDHNLDRCRTQFALVRDLEAREAELLSVVDRHRRRS